MFGSSETDRGNTEMEYEVREITLKRQLIGWGVFKFDSSLSAKTKPVHGFHIMPDDNGGQVSHRLACQMAHDLNAGIE